MVTPAHLPDSVKRVGKKENFNFSCHKGVACFTDCCRMLELAVTPYDVLRLKRGSGLSSDQFLDRYIIIERDPGEPFPRFYLTMVDDGRASCVFVSKEGCTVYENRPSACRAYPMGRAVMRASQSDTLEVHFVLMKEPHCKGFEQEVVQNVESYSSDQELNEYNRFNDALASILQHPSIRKGFIPSKKQAELFTLALYNLDVFRKMLFNGELAGDPLSEAKKETLRSDEELLLYGIEWLKKQLFIIHNGFTKNR